MLDFGKMNEALSGLGELDTVLRDIRRELRIANALLAILVSDQYAKDSGYPADLRNIFERASTVAANRDIHEREWKSA